MLSKTKYARRMCFIPISPKNAGLMATRMHRPPPRAAATAAFSCRRSWPAASPPLPRSLLPHRAHLFRQPDEQRFELVKLAVLQAQRDAQSALPAKLGEIGESPRGKTTLTFFPHQPSKCPDSKCPTQSFQYVTTMYVGKNGSDSRPIRVCD